MVLAVVTLAQVKVLLSIGSVDYDTRLTLLINAVSQRLEQHLGTPIQSGTVTEEYDVQPRAHEIFLRSITSSLVTEVKNSPTWDWDDVDAIDADLYHHDTRRDSLLLDFEPYPGSRAMRVKYTGGLAANQAALETAYPDIVQAALVQVGHEWRRRDKPDRTNATFNFGGGSSSDEVQSPLGLTRYARELLAPYRRSVFS